MWGSFGVLMDFPKQDDSTVTRGARLPNGPEIEVSTKIVGY